MMFCRSLTIFLFLSFPQKRESRKKKNWIPHQQGNDQKIEVKEDRGYIKNKHLDKVG